MWVALPLCLLSALLATGSALQCEVCAFEKQSCSGPLQPCAPSEGACITVVAEFRLVGNSFSYTGKSCLEPKNCEPGPFSLTYAHNITVRANIACCDTDGCNAGAIPDDNCELRPQRPAVPVVPLSGATSLEQEGALGLHWHRGPL
ncbi:unnamed protein product, partial [Caretta caretta]